MSSGNPISDALKRVLAEVNPATGKTNWQRLMEVARQKADAGDAGYARLLEQAQALQAANPHLTRGGQGAEG